MGLCDLGLPRGSGRFAFSLDNASHRLQNLCSNFRVVGANVELYVDAIWNDVVGVTTVKATACDYDRILGRDNSANDALKPDDYIACNDDRVNAALGLLP